MIKRNVNKINAIFIIIIWQPIDRCHMFFYECDKDFFFTYILYLYVLNQFLSIRPTNNISYIQYSFDNNNERKKNIHIIIHVLFIVIITIPIMYRALAGRLHLLFNLDRLLLSRYSLIRIHSFIWMYMVHAAVIWRIRHGCGSMHIIIWSCVYWRKCDCKKTWHISALRQLTIIITNSLILLSDEPRTCARVWCMYDQRMIWHSSEFFLHLLNFKSISS